MRRSDAVAISNRVHIDGRVERDPAPCYEPGASVHFERLGVHEALQELLANTHNLGRSGAVGLGAVARVAETVPVFRLTHGDAIAAARSLIDRR